MTPSPTLSKLSATTTVASSSVSSSSATPSSSHHETVDVEYDCYCIIDFEASCSKNDRYFKHEIIEFPAVLVASINNAADHHSCEWKVIDTFHYYVKPVMQPHLTPFCTKLTGITQTQVNNAPPLNRVMQLFHQWTKKHHLIFPPFNAADDDVINININNSNGNPDADSSNSTSSLQRKCVIVTDGPWDLNSFLQMNCSLYHIDLPSMYTYYLDIRKHFTHQLRIKTKTLRWMLHHVGLKWDGQEHSGIDDAKNISKLLIYFLELNNGKSIAPNAKLLR